MSPLSSGGAQRIFLSDWDCGVARVAWVKARTIPRRANPILKSLWPYPFAPSNITSAASSKFALVGPGYQPVRPPPPGLARAYGPRRRAKSALPYGAVVELQCGGNRDQREGIGKAVANFEIGVIGGKTLAGKRWGDYLVAPEIGVDLRRISRKPMKFRERYHALAGLPCRVHRRVKRRERDAKVRGMRYNAGFARAENRIDTVTSSIARKRCRLAFVTRGGRIIEIKAARTLQQDRRRLRPCCAAAELHRPGSALETSG